MQRGQPERPAVCSQLRPPPEMCGAGAPAAMRWLTALEALTAPIRSGADGASGVIGPPRTRKP